MEKKSKYLFLYLLSHFVCFYYINLGVKFFLPDSYSTLDSKFWLIMGIGVDFFTIYILDNFKDSLNEKLEVFSFDIYINAILLLKTLKILGIVMVYLGNFSINLTIYNNIITILISIIFIKIAIKLIKLISFPWIFGMGRYLMLSSLFNMTFVFSFIGHILKGFSFHYIGNFFIEIHKVKEGIPPIY